MEYIYLQLILAGATIDGASPTFSNVVDTSIVSGDFITAGVVGQKTRTGSLNININRDLPANEVFIKLESSNPDVLCFRNSK